MRKLVVALDFPTRDETLRVARSFAGVPVVLKLGLRVLPELSAQEVRELKAQGCELFIDVKLHDIPTQVGDAVKTWGRIGADYLTIHLSGGRKMCELAAAAARESNVKLLGVSVLTSLSGNDLNEIGVPAVPETQVLRLIKLGLESGISGFVSSVAEVPAARLMAQDMKKTAEFCTPGLRMKDETAHGDQARSYTVEEAVTAGSNLFVMGRSVVKAADPVAKAREVLRILEV